MQREIEMPEQPRKPTIFCSCLKGDRVVVVMEQSLSPEYLVGHCSYCGKMHTQKLI